MGINIEHVAMYVSDLELVRDFFVKYFDAKSNAGYHNLNTEFRSFFLTFEGGSRLEIMNKPNLEERKLDLLEQKEKMGYVHLAFQLGSKEQVDQLTKWLKDDGYEVKSGPRTTGDGYYESCIVGPEGNIIEITV